MTNVLPMHRSLLAIGCMVSLALGGCMSAEDRAAQSATTQAGLAAALAGLTPGDRTSCIPITYRSVSTHAYGATLLYEVSRNEVYRNDTAGGCEGAARGDALVSVEYQGRPCQGDIIRTVDTTSHFPTGSCALGEFVRYRRAK